MISPASARASPTNASPRTEPSKPVRTQEPPRPGRAGFGVADFGLLPGDADEYIITGGAFQGQRGFFSRDDTGAVVGSISRAGCSAGFPRPDSPARSARPRQPGSSAGRGQPYSIIPRR
jgi:hypothetical protein